MKNQFAYVYLQYTVTNYIYYKQIIDKLIEQINFE